MNLINHAVGQYHIVEEIGRGGMAVVYKAYQPTLERYVALKVLPPQFSFDRQFVERFQREGRSAARLRHPNIVVIHDVGEQDGLYYIVMEYLEGKTLRELLEQKEALPLARIATIVEQVAAALDYAHDHGFVHRDVKPANIFVSTGDRVTLTDFGIAKAAWETQLTRTGMLVGTPEYMSPEQARGEQMDHRTDIYSLGVVIYQMLAGRVPFDGTTPHAVLYKQIHANPPEIHTLPPALRPVFEGLLHKSLAKDPEERFDRSSKLAYALKDAIGRHESNWVQQQMAEAAAWLAAGEHERAIHRFEVLARSHPHDETVRAQLARAHEQARLAGIYAEVQQLWIRAQVKAEEILLATPSFPDPNGLLSQLKGRGAGPPAGSAPEASYLVEREAPWVKQLGLALVGVGSLTGILLQISKQGPGIDFAVGLLFVLLAFLSTWQALDRRLCAAFAAANLVLVLFTVAVTTAIIPRPYLLSGSFDLALVGYLLELGILCGAVILLWRFLPGIRIKRTRELLLLSALLVLLAYGLEWVKWPRLTWDRGYQVIFRQGYQSVGYENGKHLIKVYEGSYPIWLRSAMVLLPAASLSCPIVFSYLRRGRMAINGLLHFSEVVIAVLAVLCFVAVGLIEFPLPGGGMAQLLSGRSGYIGPWVAFTGLLLPVVAAIVRAMLKGHSNRPGGARTTGGRW